MRYLLFRFAMVFICIDKKTLRPLVGHLNKYDYFSETFWQDMRATTKTLTVVTASYFQLTLNKNKTDTSLYHVALFCFFKIIVLQLSNYSFIFLFMKESQYFPPPIHKKKLNIERIQH